MDPRCLPEGTFACPDESQLYVPPEDSSSSCLPAREALRQLGTAGIAVPEADRCLWILDAAVDEAGLSVPDPGFSWPSAGDTSCPDAPAFLGSARASVVDRGVFSRPVLVSLLDAVRLGDVTWVYYRVYVFEAGAPFGIRSLGTGAARWDEVGSRLVLHDRLVSLPGGYELGEAAVVHEGQVHLYGCRGPVGLFRTECVVARLTGAPNDLEDIELYAGDETWTRDPLAARPVLRSGPERWALRFHPGMGKYVMSFVPGFGNDVRLRTAERPEGPWTEDVRLTLCELPTDEPDSFCREPTLHPELVDPRRPNEIVLSYDIDSMSEGDLRRERDPEAYWPRLIRGTVPRALR